MSITGLRWAGPRAVLVELTDLASVLALHQRLEAEPLAGQLDAIAGAATLLVKLASRFHAGLARELLPNLDLSALGHKAGNEVTIEVVYGGEDLAEVGQLTGLGADGVIAAHTGQVWTGAFGGFAPGFTYLVGENGLLNVPRRSSPRTAVPAGSVALGGAFSAVYPRRSPGGWQLLGHTTAVMWDLDRQSPALVRPGDTVRYMAVREAVTVSRAEEAKTIAPDTDIGSGLTVQAPGVQSLIQDLGRPGFGDLGVSTSGAADQRSTRQANRLAGNEPGAAVVENLLGGLTVRAQGDQVLAVTGAPAALEVHNQSGGLMRHPAMHTPFALLDSETLTISPPSAGARTYLAARGGFNVPPVLGSRSTDAMSGIGPAPLAAGSFLPIGPVTSVRPVGTPEDSMLNDGSGTTALRVTLGPREDWFDAEAIELFTGQQWRVTAQSNRIGVRLAPPDDGRALARARDGELPSEGTVAGALQMPPNGHPVLFLADHPITGGYPVIAVVVPEDLPLAAQLATGHHVKFTIVDPSPLAPVGQGTASQETSQDSALSGTAL